MNNKNIFEKFDERFPEHQYSFVEHRMIENLITGQTIPKDRIANGDIKYFFHQDYEAMVKELEGEKRKESHVGIGGLHNADMEATHNQALETAIQIIKSRL